MEDDKRVILDLDTHLQNYLARHTDRYGFWPNRHVHWHNVCVKPAADTQYRVQGSKTGRSWMAFNKSFENNTQLPQRFTVSVKRHRHMRCVVDMETAVRVGANIYFIMGAPTLLKGQGFGSEFEVPVVNGEAFRELLTTTLDTSVAVPPRTITQLKMCVEEHQCKGKFVQLTSISGHVVADFYDKDDNFVRSFRVDIPELFRAPGKDLSEDADIEKLGVSPSFQDFCICGKEVIFKVKGRCTFLYDVSQTSHVSEVQCSDENSDFCIFGGRPPRATDLKSLRLLRRI